MDFLSIPLMLIGTLARKYGRKKAISQTHRHRDKDTTLLAIQHPPIHPHTHILLAIQFEMLSVWQPLSGMGKIHTSHIFLISLGE